MKVLSVVSYIDLSHRIGCTPSFWQLYKNLFELGVDNILIAYAGKTVESLWWRTRENPCYSQYKLFVKFQNLFLNNSKKKKSSSSLVPFLTKIFVYPKWLKELKYVIEKEEPDYIMFVNIPLNHLHDLPKIIKEQYNIPMIYYNADMPVHLPKYGGFNTSGNILDKTSFESFDIVITNSEGVEDDLKAMNAKKIDVLHWAVDPSVFSPVERKKDIDIFFYGYGSEFREKWMNMMLYEASEIFPNYSFALGGKAFTNNTGRVKMLGNIPFSVWREFCARSKINLNITRDSHANTPGTSTARPFELAALSSCIISNPYLGLSSWFEIGKEIFVVNNSEEIKEIYTYLIDDESLCIETGIKARQRILKDHTYEIRAKKLLSILRNL